VNHHKLLKEILKKTQRCIDAETGKAIDVSTEVAALRSEIKQLRQEAATYHPNMHLLAVERTGWSRYFLGRWVYRSEPFRRDIQRRLETVSVREDVPLLRDRWPIGKQRPRAASGARPSAPPPPPRTSLAALDKEDN
jgi:hypothetical protein